jgi:cAMP-dependent protein kinase regulator
MQTTARSLSLVGDAAFGSGQWTHALQAFAGVVRARPSDLRARVRVADALLNAGRQSLAVDVYRAVADHALRAGDPLVALIATKMLLLLDPDDETTAEILAELYSKDSERVDELEELPPAPELGDGDAIALDLEGTALFTEAARLAQHTEGTLPYPELLPPIPLLSLLDESALLAVLSHVRLVRLADEQTVFRQGEHGESFFVVAHGHVLVKRDVDDEDGGVTLAHLHAGSVFGELALISEEPRAATVIADGDVDLLELRRSDLVVASAHVPGVAHALKQFTRERFLRNLTATHPLFAGFPRDERHAVMESFRVVRFAPSEPFIVEGHDGRGLFLLLSGKASVSTHQTGERVLLATLGAGDVAGEMSLVRNHDTLATVMAEEDTEALFLARDDFESITRTHPELMRYLDNLTDERLRRNEALLHARGLLEDDEHLMI